MLNKNIKSQKELRKVSGIGASTVNRIFTGQAKPSAKTVEALIRTLGITHSELFGEEAQKEPVKPPMDLPKQVYIEIKGKVWATPFRLSIQRGLGHFVEGLPGEQNCFALQVEGDSMLPAYVAGDYVICRPHKIELTPYGDSDDGPSYTPYEIIAPYHNRDIVVTHNGETNLKRVQIERKVGPKYEIHMASLNDKYPPVKVRMGDEWIMQALVIRTQKPEIPE